MSRFIVPQNFVQLQLHAHRQVVCQYPLSQVASLQLRMAGRKQNVSHLARQLVLIQFETRPFIVLAVANHEFHLVMSETDPDLLLRVCGGSEADDDDADDLVVDMDSWFGDELQEEERGRHSQGSLCWSEYWQGCARSSNVRAKPDWTLTPVIVRKKAFIGKAPSVTRSSE